MIKNKKYKKHLHLVRRMIFTNRCRLCAKVLPLNEDVCESCSVEKIRVPQQVLQSFSFSNRYFDNLTVPFYYDDPVRKCIHNFKYNSFKRAGEFLADEIINVIERDFSDEEPDYITCVPMTKSRRLKRGYNQCEILIKHIAKAFNRKSTPDLLKKIRNTRPQVSLNRKERAENLKGAFSVNRKYDIKGKTVLICDDVLTTGSTLGECAKTLKKAGAKRVICVTGALNSKNF